MRYDITEGRGSAFIASFADSGEAHRYAQRYSKRTDSAVRVRRVTIIKPALSSSDEGVYYSNGKETDR